MGNLPITRDNGVDWLTVVDRVSEADALTRAQSQTGVATAIETMDLRVHSN